MSLIDYAALALRRGWIILIPALIAAGLGWQYSQRQTPLYRAAQIVLIQPQRVYQEQVATNLRLLNSYAVYLESEAIAAEVIEAINLPMTPGDLAAISSITPGEFDLILEIAVQHQDGDLANLIAFTWGQQLVAFRNRENAQLLPQDRIDAYLQDFPRYTQEAPNTRRNVIFGGIAGALAGGLIVFALEYRRNRRIRSPYDLDLPALAIIPAE